MNDVRYGQFAALTVPVDYERPNGKTIDVEYRIDRANKATKGYLLFLEGGPGADVRNTRSRFETSPADPTITDNYDRVYFNIRGVGENSTLVQCDMSPTASVEGCFDSIAQIAPLESFTTRNFARDIETLRIAIGIDSWDAVYGSSYGTRLAQEYVRMFPDRADKLVLDSTVSPALPSIHLIGKRFNESLQQVFQHCHDSESCMALFAGTTPEAAFDSVLMRADDGLLTVSTPNGPVPIGRENIVDLVSGLLRYGPVRPAIPQVVRDLAASPPDTTLLGQIAASVGDGEDINGALLLVVQCNEDFRYEQGLDPDSLGHDAGVFGAQTYAAFATECPAGLARIPAGKEDVVPELVHSAVPSCILAGQEDPVTPLEEATAVASQLSQGRLLSFPYSAHGVGLSACGDQVIRRCLVQPPAKVDASCVDREPNPYVYSSETAMTAAQMSALRGKPSLPSIRPLIRLPRLR